MSARILFLSVAISALVSACSTTQENPIYQQSAKYKVHSPYSASTGTTTGQATTSYASYSTSTPTVYTDSTTPQVYHASTSRTGEVSYSQVNHSCLDKEGNRKLIGTGVGGAVGALAGSEIIGGTKGAVIGAVVGGAAGYGVGDISVNCDPIPVQPETYRSTPANHTYTSQHHSPQTTTYSSSTNAASTTHTGYPTTVQAETVTAASSATVSSESYNAPTDIAYGDTIGTPGYHAMQANGELDETRTASIALPDPSPSNVSATPIPSPAPVTAPAPRPNTGYPQYTSQAYPAPNTPSTPQYQSLPQAVPAPAPVQQLAQSGGNMHLVVEGDTVYSLSRKLCVGVEDIRQLNNLNGAFNIRLDEYIRLPNSRC